VDGEGRERKKIRIGLSLAYSLTGRIKPVQRNQRSSGNYSASENYTIY